MLEELSTGDILKILDSVNSASIPPVDFTAKGGASQ